MTQKHPSTMTDAEFQTALQNRPWRNTTATKPAPAPKPVAEMTDAEYAAAVRARAWRHQ
jgi:hypothetical protein